MASQDETDIFNPQKHTKVGDIVVIGGNANLYKVISTSPLRVENTTKYPSNKNGEMFNLTHFMKNFKEYMELVKETDVHDPWDWSNPAVQQYEDYILDFKDFMKHNFPSGEYTYFDDFLFFCNHIGHKDMSDYFDELKKKRIYEKIMENVKEDAPKFKTHKSSKKSSKKVSKKSHKKASKKSPKKASKKSPKKASKKSPKSKRQ
jgi:hypothetical protein